MKKTSKGTSSTPSELITEYIRSVGDWRGAMLARIRKIILGAAPDLTEEWKWGSPVWTHNGLVCSASAFKQHVKVNFFQGASLDDPKGLFNAGLDAKLMRSIDFQEGDKIDAAGLGTLVKAAVAWNARSK
jgi:hypothetical protein